MYITTVDSTSFQELKQDQSLHVTFAGFIENLIHILQDCQAGKLDIFLIQVERQQDVRLSDTCLGPGGMKSNMHYQLQFVEMRPFKNLIHLSLPCRMAPCNVVLFYMNNIMDVLQVRIITFFQRTYFQFLMILYFLSRKNVPIKNKPPNSYNMIYTIIYGV